VETDFDALVVGGAAAGLSAALVLGRARVRTLIGDAGEPSNASAPAIGGLLGQNGTSPARLYAAGREQLTELPTVELREGVVTGIETAGEFRATLAGGETITAARILIAGGMRYGVPDVPGVSKLWGDRAFMCPYCHGWEHRDQKIAILGGAGVAQRVALLRSWTSELVVLAERRADRRPGRRPGRRAAGGVRRAGPRPLRRRHRARGRRAARRGTDGPA
jgi:thioredoxin reductase